MKAKYFDIEKVNESVINNVKSFVDSCEESYRSQLVEISEKILARETPVRVVLLGGPSCAGKTTSSRLLDYYMTERGKNVVPIEMDNFFISLNERPRLENGSRDYDSINIVNLDLMEKCFTELFTTGRAMFPTYDFINGVSVPDSELIEGGEDTIFILEGIHALNPKLIEKVGTKDVYKIFINNDYGYKSGDTKIEFREFRMVRRMVRDVQFRNVSMANTIKHWKDVTDAEDLYIWPYSENVDSTINTSHAYEINLYKKDVEDAITRGEIDLEIYPWFKVFKNIELLDKNILPKTTLMKEFVSFEEGN